MIDLLTSNGDPHQPLSGGENQMVNLYYSNQDFIWKSIFSRPRQ